MTIESIAQFLTPTTVLIIQSLLCLIPVGVTGLLLFGIVLGRRSR